MTKRRLHIHACVAVLVLASCSKTHQDPISTETGNPPVIDRELIALVLIDGRAHVVGEPGAIEPAGGEVEVTIERTAAVVRGPVEDDGAFDVEVDARLSDAFSVRVIAGSVRSKLERFSGHDAGAAEPSDGGPVAVDGSRPEDAGVAACDDCFDEALTWRRIDPTGEFPELPDVSYVLAGCHTLAVRGDLGEQCTTPIESCEPSMGTPTSESVKILLANEDVQSAFEVGGSHGEPAGVGSYIYQLQLGDRELVYRACHAGPDAEIPCTANLALESLVLELTHLQDTYFCELPPPRDPNCDSAWDPGTGEETEWWYWHDPNLDACLPVRGDAAGGNGNRYPSHVECLEACPEPADVTECADGRAWSEEGCFQCGLGGGCLYIQSFCPLPCETDEDCDRDNVVTSETEQVCREGFCGPSFVGPCL